jgi:nitrite reductase/ring-hydroxylating ferredoxin subunit
VIQVPEVVEARDPLRLCGIDDVPENGAISVDIELTCSQSSFIVTRCNGQVHAYRNLCPHAGRRLDWAPGKILHKDRVLVCAVHGASFRIETGLCISGPCRGEQLESIRVRIEGDAVLLDEPSGLHPVNT